MTMGKLQPILAAGRRTGQDLVEGKRRPAARSIVGTDGQEELRIGTEELEDFHPLCVEVFEDFDQLAPDPLQNFPATLIRLRSLCIFSQ